MKRDRKLKKKQNHFLVLVNPSASKYKGQLVRKLTGGIRRRGHFYSVFESDSAGNMLKLARKACGLLRRGRKLPDSFLKRGKVTAIVVCGGDGTFNVAAQVAHKANIPIGILPMGDQNNIAHALMKTDDPDEAIKIILKNRYRLIDAARIDKRMFFGSLALGFIPHLVTELKKNNRPRFSFGWRKIGSHAAEKTEQQEFTLKLDAFQFEIKSHMFNVQLLNYSGGLAICPVATFDDGQAEVMFDVVGDKKIFSTFIKDVFKKKYTFGTEIKLFRGKDIVLEPVKNKDIYLDGDLVRFQEESLRVQIDERQLKALC